MRDLLSGKANVAFRGLCAWVVSGLKGSFRAHQTGQAEQSGRVVGDGVLRGGLSLRLLQGKSPSLHRAPTNLPDLFPLLG